MSAQGDVMPNDGTKRDSSEQVAIVTGASRGIGLAVAEVLAARLAGLRRAGLWGALSACY